MLRIIMFNRAPTINSIYYIHCINSPRKLQSTEEIHPFSSYRLNLLMRDHEHTEKYVIDPKKYY